MAAAGNSSDDKTRLEPGPAGLPPSKPDGGATAVAGEEETFACGEADRRLVRSHLESILNSIAEGFVVADPDGRIIHMNSSALAIHGLRSVCEARKGTENLARTVEVMTLDGRPLPVEEWPISRALGGESFWGIDLLVRATGEEASWVGSFGGGPIYDDAKMVMAVVTVQDITRRKQAESALRESEARFKASIDNLFDGFAIFAGVRDDSGALVDFRTEYVNGAGRAPRGIPCGERKGRGLLGLFPFLAATAIFGGFVRVVETGEPFSREEFRCGADAAVGAYAGRAFTFHAFKLGDGFAVNWRDVTEHVREKAEIRALNETLEARVAERTAQAEARAMQLRALTVEIAGVERRERMRLAEVLHDHLQQYLAVAKIRVSSLREQCCADALRASARDAVEALDAAIGISRTLSTELSPPMLHHAGLVPALEWLTERQGEQYGLQVELAAGEGVEPAMEDMRDMFFQAVRELLFNVVKHARAERAWVTLDRAAEGRLVITVRDNGTGFDTTKLARADNYEGFGILSLRERLLGQGGSVEVESSLGLGTRVTLVSAPRTLPGEVAAPR